MNKFTQLSYLVTLLFIVESNMLAGSGYHSLFLKANYQTTTSGYDTTLWAMGQNTYGQLGDGTASNRTTPVQVDSNVSTVSAGAYHSLYVKTDGTLWAMGQNSNGQLGDGTTSSRTTPLQIATNVSSVTAGVFHSLYVKTDGTLWAMGLNNHGQLGDGTTTDRNTSVQIATNVSSVSAGPHHSLYVKTDGTLWAMGQNTNGQLGDGTGFSRVSPVKVSTGVHLYEMPPGAHATVLVHEATGGNATKSAIYTMGSTASLYATPTGGYLFNGWTGGTTSSQNPITLVANQNIEVNATFTPDTNDTDGDGLSNYREVVILGTDPNDINSDDDNFTDYEEDQYGLDPNVANTNLLAYISTRENTVRAEGNASGIAYVQANTSAYNLYTEADKNASDLTQYTSGKTAGITEGNASGIVYVQANTSAYNLYTEADKNASVESAKTTARAEATATLQADLASKGLSLISYVEQIEFSKPYTQNWFYQPGMGWMWTDEDTFPYIYLVKAANETGSWLYFGQLSGQDSASFYDYVSESWITPSDSK